MQATNRSGKLPAISEVHFNREAVLCSQVKRPCNDKELQTDESRAIENEGPKEEEISENVTVKFRVRENRVIAQVYPNDLTLADVKFDLAERFEVPQNLLVLKQCNQILDDTCFIRNTGCNEFGIHEYDLKLKTSANKMSSTDSVPDLNEYNPLDEGLPQEKIILPKYVLNLDVYFSKQRLPDFIKVYVPAEESRTGVAKSLVVEIRNEAIAKPLLCAYKHTLTGIHYMDAFSQTGPFINKCKWQTYVSRDTQTQELKPKSIDTMHDQTSQCWLDENNERFWPESGDYEITAGKYETYAQMVRRVNKLGKIVLIQRNFRRFKWTRWMRQWAAEYRRLVKNRIDEEEAHMEELKRREKREKHSKENPRTKDDFDMLLSEVHTWKMSELNRIVRYYEGAGRVAEMSVLLHQEIMKLNAIERQRRSVFKSMEDYRLQQSLKKLGEPIKWIGYGNTVIYMDLIRTQRVRFLTEVYEELRKPLPKEERIELINKIRRILLNERSFPKFPELYELYDREKNLLLYASHANVNLLRKRQNILFLELIQFSTDPLPARQDCRMCVVCKQVKPYSQFALQTKQNKVDTCRKCFYLKVPSTENRVYTAILRSIQREERRKRCSGSFAFIMQVEDIRYLIQSIWHGHSILSKCNIVKRLRLPRWIKSQEWTPWNCVCLTEYETRNHNKIENVTQIYDKNMLSKVDNCQKLARSTFHNLTAVSVEFTETGCWWKVGLNRQRKVKLDELTTQKGADTIIKRTANEFNCEIGKIL